MPVYLEQRPGRTPVWAAEVSIAGKRHRKRFASKREAERWAAAVKLGAPLGGRSPTGCFDNVSALSLEEAADLCRRERDGWGAKDRSLRQRLDVVLAHFGAHTSLASIGPAQLQGFVNALRETPARGSARGRGLSSSTINRYLSVLSAIIDHARRTGRSDHNPQVPWQTEGQGKLEWLTREQEDALARSMPSEHALILRLLCATGLRAGELWGLKSDHIEDQWLRLWDTKNGKARSVPVDPALSRPLRRLIEDGALPGYREHYYVFKRTCRALGFSSTLTIHSMRHTTGTRLAAAVSGPVVQKFLGHASYRTTQRYVHLSDEELQRAAQTLRPSLALVGRTA